MPMVESVEMIQICFVQEGVAPTTIQTSEKKSTRDRVNSPYIA